MAKSRVAGSRRNKAAGPRAVASRRQQTPQRPRSSIEAPTAPRLTLSYLNAGTNEGMAVDTILLPDELRDLSATQLVNRFIVPAMEQIKDRYGK